MRGRPYSPQGSDFDQASQAWLELQSDPEAVFDLEYNLDASQLRPQVTWGTSPEMVVSIDDVIPDPVNAPDKVRSQDWSRALEYMDLIPGTPISSVWSGQGIYRGLHQWKN